MRIAYNILSILLITCMSSFGFAQELEVIGSSGEHVAGSNGSMSYTIGEVVVSTGQSSENVLTQGFHQGFLTPSAIDEAPSKFAVSLYPNPTSDRLVVESAHLSDFQQVNLYDMNGRLVWQQPGSMNEETRMEINFLPYAAGNYLLHMMEKGSGEVYTYKIVKSH